MQDLIRLLQENSSKLGYHRFGFAPLETGKTFSHYETWIQNQFHGDMNYLERHLPIKKEPINHFKEIRSVILLTFNYNTVTEQTVQLKANPTPHLRVSLYAKEGDYHQFINEQLQKIKIALQIQFPKEHFASAVDSSPLLERDLAATAGLGWFGKNTCLIDQKSGSLFFLGEILTSMKLEPLTSPSHDFCGNCTRCLEACPTGAILPGRVLNARKCISYLTIEARTLTEEPLREKMGDWFFGCDLCQTVCPWNRKHLLSQALVAPLVSRKDIIEDLRFILKSSNKKLTAAFQNSALLRARPKGLKRNALIVARNLFLVELEKEIEPYLNHPELEGLARWALTDIRKDRTKSTDLSESTHPSESRTPPKSKLPIF